MLCLALYLMGNAEVMELSKLPILLEHYSEHKAIVKNLTFLEFLQDHYTGQADLDSDQNRDHQLPFKSMDLHSTCTGPFIVGHFASVQEVQRLEIDCFYSDYSTGVFNSGFHSAVWQPPKSC